MLLTKYTFSSVNHAGNKNFEKKMINEDGNPLSCFLFGRIEKQLGNKWIHLNKQRFQIHGWIFDVRTGKLKDLELDLEKEFMEIREIYDLKPLENK